jgi:hypothetical protein
MQALDSFISPIPSFEGDIPILAIPVSAQPPGGKADSDPSTGASVGVPRTRASKRKATANPTPQKKTKKYVGKPLGGIKINEPVQTTPASTPPSIPRKGILILQLSR